MRILYKDIQISTPGAKALFVRYNPDNYRPADKQEIHSKEDRENYLLMILQHTMEATLTSVELGVIYLFYDGFNGSPEVQRLNPYILPAGYRAGYYLHEED